MEADLYDSEQENVREQLLATLSRSHFGLVEAVKQARLGGQTNFLLVVDQFEEIFRFHEAGQIQQEVANEFVSLLLEAVAQQEVPIYVVLTMRSDFIGECGQFEGLAEMVNRGEFLLPRLHREQYKRIIEGPGDLHYLTVEEVLGTVRGTCVTRGLGALVELRRTEYQMFARSELSRR